MYLHTVSLPLVIATVSLVLLELDSHAYDLHDTVLVKSVATVEDTQNLLLIPSSHTTSVHIHIVWKYLHTSNSTSVRSSR